jgi:hypothetical protein
MWEILTEDTAWETMAFEEKEDAESWIKERARARFGLEDLTFD